MAGPNDLGVEEALRQVQAGSAEDYRFVVASFHRR
jgi:hypothetical protein